MKNKILDFFNSAAVLVLFMSLGMYDSENRTLYRLVYKDGDYGAWDDDIDRIRRYAKFFGAEIESREFKMWDEKQKESEEQK